MPDPSAVHIPVPTLLGVIHRPPAEGQLYLSTQQVADRYGLSEMHQLRGRVGRYKHQAYCYLLIDPHTHVSPSAAKRLRAIEEYSEMGAGFALAIALANPISLSNRNPTR